MLIGKQIGELTDLTDYLSSKFKNTHTDTRGVQAERLITAHN
jgi:hypothetical protein